MRGYWRWAFVILTATAPAANAAQTNVPWQRTPWSVTVYVGPSTTKYFVAVLKSLKLQPTGAMAGLAVNGRLLYLGQGISLAGEAQVTQYFFGHKDTTFALGLGLQCNDIFGFKRTSFSIYNGMSYATDPPFTSIGYNNHIWPSARVKLLNYVSIEVAVGLSSEGEWEGVFRLYHRSGAFGIYSIGDDDGMVLGWGVRRRF